MLTGAIIIDSDLRAVLIIVLETNLAGPLAASPRQVGLVAIIILIDHFGNKIDGLLSLDKFVT